MFKNLSILFLGSVLFLQILPQFNTYTTKVDKVVKITDGDTVGLQVCKYFNVRLLDCWALEITSKDPEIKKKALEAKEFLKKTLESASEVALQIPVNEDLSKSFTFGRLLGIVYAKIDGKWVNVNELMVEKGYATKTKE